jgi:hypothetical protein
MSFLRNQARKRALVDTIEGVISLILRYEECKSQTNLSDPTIPVLLKHDVSGQHVDVQMEYFIYINTYGVPVDGEFDPALLERIRQGLVQVV